MVHNLEDIMTSKQRAFLKSLASKEDTILQIGKEGFTPENTAAIEEALKPGNWSRSGSVRTVLRISR